MKELKLPEEIEISRPGIEDLDEMEEYISDYLSDEYGFCVNSFKFDFDMRENLHIRHRLGYYRIKERKDIWDNIIHQLLLKIRK